MFVVCPGSVDLLEMRFRTSVWFYWTSLHLRTIIFWKKKANCFNSKMWLDQIKICICIPLNPKLKFHFESKHRIWWTLCTVDDNLPLSSSFSGISSGIWQTRRATSRSLHLQLQSCPAGLLIGCLSYCLPAIGPPDPIRFFHRHTLNGEDILAPVLLSEQTSSFYFFHIFVPSLPHYRYYYFFYFNFTLFHQFELAGLWSGPQTRYTDTSTAKCPSDWVTHVSAQS